MPNLYTPVENLVPGKVYEDNMQEHPNYLYLGDYLGQTLEIKVDGREITKPQTWAFMVWTDELDELVTPGMTWNEIFHVLLDKFGFSDEPGTWLDNLRPWWRAPFDGTHFTREVKTLFDPFATKQETITSQWTPYKLPWKHDDNNLHIDKTSETTGLARYIIKLGPNSRPEKHDLAITSDSVSDTLEPLMNIIHETIDNIPEAIIPSVERMYMHAAADETDLDVIRRYTEHLSENPEKFVKHPGMAFYADIMSNMCKSSKMIVQLMAHTKLLALMAENPDKIRLQVKLNQITNDLERNNPTAAYVHIKMLMSGLSTHPEKILNTLNIRDSLAFELKTTANILKYIMPESEV